MPAGTTTESVAERRESCVSDADLGRLRELLFSKLGLFVGEDRNPELGSSLEAGARSTPEGTPAAVLDPLEAGRLEREPLRRLLAPILGRRDSLIHNLNEFRVYRDEFEEPLTSRARLRGDEALRVWCLNGDDGVEPYRIGLLLESWQFDEETGLPLKITATNGSLEALRDCRERRWDSPELSGLDPKMLEAAFDPVGGRWRMGDWADSVVELLALDPEAPGEAEGLGTFDVVFARHVLCQLMPGPREQLLELILQRLHAGGLLFLGRGETPGPSGGPLRLVLYPGGAVYRKPLRN